MPVGWDYYTERWLTPMLLSMKLLMTILLAAGLAGCLGSGNIPHEDSPGSTPRNEGAPLCHDGTPPPCVIRN
jgi:hypothetical protein